MKKGFTLIELLAVIVILAIIALIATPIILGVVENARKSAAGSSALGYLDAVEKAIALDGLDNIVYPTGNIDILTSERYKDIEVQGEGPSQGTLVVSDRYLITSAVLCVNNYKVELSGHKIKSITKDGCDSIGNATPAECFEYENIDGKNNEIMITNYKNDNDNCPLDVVIPSIIDGKKVIWINCTEDLCGSFFDKGITSVILPSTLEAIGGLSFASNKLKEIIIPTSVTEIGNAAFANNQLTSIEIPPSVTEIGGYAFSHNQLTEVTIPSSVTYLGSEAFYNNQLTNVTIKGKSNYREFDLRTQDRWSYYDSIAGSYKSILGWAKGCDDSCITWEP